MFEARWLLIFSSIITLYVAYRSRSNLSINEDEFESSTGKIVIWPLDDTKNCFRAAVFEFAHETALKNDTHCSISTEINLKKLGRAAKVASQHGARIVVFPEDGVFYCDKEAMFTNSPEIPDPETLDDSNNIPCLQAEGHSSSKILKKLSCMARENNIFIVANFGTKQICRPETKFLDSICPSRGYFVFNTDVVLDNGGRFIKRYRKFNPFIEAFDKAPTLDLTYFDSEFGRFGVFTCFDMLFKSPAIDLVEKHHIDTALFPTLWYDELPMLSAIQYQDGWSLKNKVNLLAANIHRRSTATVGSGIFSGSNFVYTGPYSEHSRLLFADLPKNNSVQEKCAKSFNPLSVDVTDKMDVDGSNSESHGDIGQYQPYNFALKQNDGVQSLTGVEGEFSKCSGRICCTIRYVMNNLENKDLRNTVVLIVRDDNRDGPFNWYEQICLLATLEKPIDDELKATFSKASQVKFSKLEISGTFDSDYVYPIAAHNVSTLIDRKDRSYDCTSTSDNRVSCSISYHGKPSTIYSYGLFGRVYERDIMPKGW